MPGKLRVRVLAGRDLPIMDRASETADAFVEIKFSQTAFKTEIFPKSLNPQWMSDWFTFEGDDEDLQDECLQFRVMDYDTYSANDAIGRVYLDLNPLLSKNGPSQIAGWLPIYDTMHGIRGELNVVVRLEHFTDINKFRQSSCGIDVFATSGIPSGYQLVCLHGLVEELIANDDPEYQWIEKIRTPRASNEARQVLFSKMTGQLIRRLGRKVLEVGGNAIIGYRQCFDMEGETGIVVRGLGTGVTLEKIDPFLQSSPTTSEAGGQHLWKIPLAETEEWQSGDEPGEKITKPMSISADRRTATSSRDSSSGGATVVDAAVLENEASTLRASSHSPAGGALLAAAGNLSKSPMLLPPVADATILPQKTPHVYTNVSRALDHMEYPFLTMQVYPVGFIVHLGSIVCARSVKLLSRIETPDEATIRDSWWLELRSEMRAHMKAVGCNTVVGYREQCSIFKDLCILSAMGTAAIVDKSAHHVSTSQHHLVATSETVNFFVSVDKTAAHYSSTKDKVKALCVDTALANNYFTPMRTISSSAEPYLCSACHISYSENALPFPVKLNACACCGNGYVPNMLLMTIDPLAEIGITGDFNLIQARVVRKKQDSSGETLANELSDMLPFIEHDLHSQLASKLMRSGKNAVYGLRTNISIGDSHIVVLATGTAVCLAPLDSASVEKLQWTAEQESKKEQKALDHLALLAQGRPLNNQTPSKPPKLASASESNSVNKLSKSDSLASVPGAFGDVSFSRNSGGGKFPLDLAWDRDAVLAELAEEDGTAATVYNSKDVDFPKDFHCCNTFFLPHVSSWNVADMRQLQLFVRVFQGGVGEDDEFNAKILSNRIDWIFKSTCFKFRKMKPLCLTSVVCDVNFSQHEEYQITFIGMALTGNTEFNKGSADLGPFGCSPQNVVTPARRVRQASGNSSISGGILTQASTEEPQGGGVFPVDASAVNTYETRRDSLSASCPPLLAATTWRKRCISVADETPAVKSRQIFVTPLPAPSHAPIGHYLGHYDFFFIRETTSLREAGGLEAFAQAALTEVLYVVQAHVAAFGGHGMVAFRFTQTELTHNVNRNQAQCLVGVAGDIVTMVATPRLAT